LNQLSLGALLHDVGKQFVPPEILKKETLLTKREWEEMEMHPIYGYECVESLVLDDAVKEIILGHHLWANGKGGYPQTLASPCLLSQITAVADVVDAMTSDRPYRPALSISTCLDYLEEYIDTKFNRDVVQMFKTILSKERAWGDECKIWRGCDTDRPNARKSKDTN
jgi:HD-GYP domain-containing protein (c-di-GMP phosphodiesterase class II)